MRVHHHHHHHHHHQHHHVKRRDIRHCRYREEARLCSNLDGPNFDVIVKGFYCILRWDPKANSREISAHCTRHSLEIDCHTRYKSITLLLLLASSFHWLSSSIFTCSSFVRSVTPPLISTIWCFRPYKPYIFCEDMILATYQCHHIRIWWPSYHHKADKTKQMLIELLTKSWQMLYFLKVGDSWLSDMIFWSVVLVIWSIY